ncbi:hypothetical protein BC332_14712 [Capsicum chinense]|nr:hypothetical protein BC332_14712 [Capsicum chinense]
MTALRQVVKHLLRLLLDDVETNIERKYNMNHALISLSKNMDDCISSCHHSKSSTTMTDEQLNFLLLNLHFLSMYRAEKIFPLVTQYEILQNLCVNVRDFHGLILNGYVECEIVEYVLPQFQLMDERVRLFFWNSQTYGDSRLFKLAHILMKIILIELEVMQLCHTNLKASTSAEVGRSIKHLLEISPDILREYLIHLQEHIINFIIATTPGARNIHVMIEFLLIFLTDMPKDFIHVRVAFEVELGPRSISLTIHHDKLFDLLARVGALNREVSTIVHDLEEKSRNKESIDETCGVNLDLLEEKMELVKEDLGHDDIGLVKEALEFIRSFFVNVEQGLNKHLWARVLDVAYEIKLINEEDSNISEKIPKNRSLTVVNSTKKTVESKSLTAGKIIVGFEEETNWLISKLTSGLKYLDVISITDTGSDLKFSEDIDIADMLRKQLFGKRYLIVLDDVWDTTTWGAVTRPFSEVEKGKRAFGEQSCPDELLDVGKEIVQNWKGLPLVVDLIAEVIARREKTKSVWLEVRNNLNSFILNSEVDVIKVVELSYDHLPHHVKPCFIYLASYPKESEVVRDELKMYLHAEGLVERTEMKSEEEVMDNLISSSLVSLPYKSDIPWAIWNPPLTRRGWPQPKCVARVGVSESDTP